MVQNIKNGMIFEGCGLQKIESSKKLAQSESEKADDDRLGTASFFNIFVTASLQFNVVVLISFYLEIRNRGPQRFFVQTYTYTVYHVQKYIIARSIYINNIIKPFNITMMVYIYLLVTNSLYEVSNNIQLIKSIRKICYVNG